MKKYQVQEDQLQLVSWLIKLHQIVTLEILVILGFINGRIKALFVNSPNAPNRTCKGITQENLSLYKTSLVKTERRKVKRTINFQSTLFFCLYIIRYIIKARCSSTLNRTGWIYRRMVSFTVGYCSFARNCCSKLKSGENTGVRKNSKHKQQVVV